jgi:hypothetical protein
MFEPGPDTRLRLQILLRQQEEESLARIRFPLPDPPDPARQQSLRAASLLARSLIARNGVPKVRWRYFTDPELNVGAGRSRKDEFHDAGIDASGILLDPHFLPILHYWIFGPDLPPDVINWFFVAVNQHTDIPALRRLVRQAVRDHDLRPDDAAEEFFKLSLEAGLDVEAAWSVRTAVRKVRTGTRSHSRAAADGRGIESWALQPDS